MQPMSKRAEYLGPEKRRPLVLDAALSIFAEGGFADAAMSAIAERAEVSKAVLYDCFPGGKQQIFYALLDRSQQHFQETILAVTERTNKMPLGDALLEWVNHFLDYATEHPASFRLIFGEVGTADEAIAAKAETAKQAIVEKMGERTYQIMEEAGVPITPIAGIYNKAMVASAEEMARWVLADPSLPKRKIAKALVVWWMNGFDTIIPGDAYKKPTP